MKQFFVRLLSLMTGLLFFAFGIVLGIKANIGYAPWEVFHVGLANTIGLSLGTITITVGIAIAIIVTLLGEKLGFGTIMNMIVIGLFIDIIFPRIPIAKNPIIGTMILISGLLSISIGSYFYIRSAFGVGPRDNLMIVLTRRTKFPVGLCRGAIELLVTVIGWFLGGMVGFGTVISVVAIGFCIQLTFKVFRFDVTAIKHETLGETYAALKRSCQKS